MCPPDESAVRRDLASLRFRKGEASGKWRLVGYTHPELFVAISTAPREASADWLLLRMDVGGFPAVGPTGRLFHGTEDRPLISDEWPRGVGNGPLPIFSDFGPCLYHPIDRLSFAGGHWAGQYADECWHPHFHLTRYLEVPHDALHSPEFAGARILPGTVALPPRLVEKAAA